MPVIQVTLMEGRTDDQKEALIAALTEAAFSSIGAPRERVRILLNEIPKAHFGIGGKSAKALGR